MNAADIYIEDWADAVGVTIPELLDSIDRLISQGWLKPEGNGKYRLTKPELPADLLDLGAGYL